MCNKSEYQNELNFSEIPICVHISIGCLLGLVFSWMESVVSHCFYFKAFIKTLKLIFQDNKRQNFGFRTNKHFLVAINFDKSSLIRLRMRRAFGWIVSAHAFNGDRYTHTGQVKIKTTAKKVNKSNICRRKKSRSKRTKPKNIIGVPFFLSLPCSWILRKSKTLFYHFEATWSHGIYLPLSETGQAYSYHIHRFIFLSLK